MSVAVIDNATNRGVKNDIQQTGFPPQLFLVAGGSYASNSSYGSGSASTGNYDSQTPPITVRDQLNPICQTRTRVRQQDTDVDFDVTICLDSSQPDPGFTGTDELRIRNLPLTNPLSGLKPADPNFGLPLFLEVEVVDENGLLLLPTGGANRTLQARLLYGSQLALIQQESSAPPTVTAVTSSQLTFGLASGTFIRIHARGQYKGTAATV
uniref:Uncharacterized protein n=1 Tax=Marseillevirus LCMAC101 TaxID=2506602 RepID=A0A481YSC2_9VIRU|nr:MAG: uncharacterized protein LCMAC101_07580 [Marseillevirus LCMAC101]